MLQKFARERNVSEFQQRVSDLNKQDIWYAPPWGVEAASELVGRLIAVCLAEGSPRTVDQAADLFAAFRHESSELVPEAFPLIVEVAHGKRVDAVAARMYAEYLVCSGVEVDSEEYRLVKAMHQRCGGRNGGAETAADRGRGRAQV